MQALVDRQITPAAINHACALSPIDEERFGIRVARAPHLDSGNLAGSLEYCLEERVRLLIARCRTEDLELVHKLEAGGFQLMDTLVTYRRGLLDIPPAVQPEDMEIRQVRPGEESAVQFITGQAMERYCSHYHADPRLERTLCDEAYRSWAVRSCVSREVAGDVLVGIQKYRMLGFVTLENPGDEESRISMFCVAPHAQGKGLSRVLLAHGMAWCRALWSNHVVCSTQITNLAAQKVLVKSGFEFSSACYTFHKWFD